MFFKRGKWGYFRFPCLISLPFYPYRPGRARMAAKAKKMGDRPGGGRRPWAPGLIGGGGGAAKISQFWCKSSFKGKVPPRLFLLFKLSNFDVKLVKSNCILCN